MVSSKAHINEVSSELTHNVNAFVTGHANFGALRTQINSHNTHDCGLESVSTRLETRKESVADGGAIPDVTKVG